MILRARFVAPVEGPVIENGAVVIKDGLITAVGPAKDLADRSAIDHGDAVICPGFVNSHTHLELGYLAGKVPPTDDFIEWLRQVYRDSIANPPTRGQIETSMRSGIEQSLRAGVTTIGDITRNPAWSRPVLRESGLRVVSFGEVTAIGLRRALLNERLEAAASHEYESERLSIGISPHAPYSVEPDGFSTCAKRLQHFDALRVQQVGAEHPPYRLSVHVGETPDEDDFVRFKTGRFADYLKELGLWDDSIPTNGCGAIELLHRCGLLTSRTVLVHANFVSDNDISLIAKSGASVAYCPRTHEAFGHPPHPFREMISAGVNVAIATDSLASNPSLSILDELRFLHSAYPEITPTELMEMGTIYGARALGLHDRCGSLSVGKAADVAVIPIPLGKDSWKSILDAPVQPSAVFVDGGHVL